MYQQSYKNVVLAIGKEDRCKIIHVNVICMALLLNYKHVLVTFLLIPLIL